MSDDIVVAHTSLSGCACPACSGADISLDPQAGGVSETKPIWSPDQIAAYLNRTGLSWKPGAGNAVQSDGDQRVINFGFHESQATLAANGYRWLDPVTGRNTVWAEYNNFAAFSEAQRTAAREALQYWDDVVAVSLAESHVDQADIAFGNLASAPTTQAFAILPSNNIYFNPDYTPEQNAANNAQVLDLAGDIWISASQVSNSQLDEGGYGMHTLAHEIGHAIGISHPGRYNAAPGVSITYANNAEYAQDTRAYSVMSYFNGTAAQGARHFDFRTASTAYSATPLIHDIAAAQRIYGADMTTRTGDTTYGFNSNAARDAFDFVKTPAPVMAIWDAGGIDTLDASGFVTTQLIDLTPGSLSSIGGVTFDTAPSFEQVNANRAAAGLPPVSQTNYDANMAALKANPVVGRLLDNVAIAYGVTVENARGGSGSDTIVGNAANNQLFGNAGSDVLTGKEGNDLLDGGSGADRLAGGTGDDRYVVDDLGDVVTELAGEGVDLVESSVDYVLGAGLENLKLTGTALAGTGNAGSNALTGNAAANTLKGLDGDDVLAGEGGDDRLEGGAGKDKLEGGGGADDLHGQDGDDLIGGQDGDDFVLGGGGADHLYGDAGDDVIGGQDGDDLLVGGAGRDHLIGEAGDDRIGGQDGDDFVLGGLGADALNGEAGDDVMGGQEDNDFLLGGAGRDRLFGDAGDDVVGGQEDDDVINGGSGRDLLYGDAGDDQVVGGADSDRLFGGDGDDLLAGEDGDDRLEGGAGKDKLEGGGGADDLHGQDGDDLIGGQDGDDFVLGGGGADHLYGDAGDDVIGGQDGDDLLVGGAGRDHLIGEAGDDRIGGQDGDDFVLGGLGADALNGEAGDDVMGGQEDNDFLLGGAGRDRLFGDAGDDVVGGQEDDDVINGGSGRDLLYGDAGDDQVAGDADSDRLEGGAGKDKLDGGAGDDDLHGQDGDDHLEGGLGRDLIFGGVGNDIIFGGGDADQLFGGAGADRFGFQSTADSAIGASDIIVDFNLLEGDLIDLSAIDAVSHTAADEAFTFVTEFSNQAGQAVLRYDAAANTTTVQLDVDGDGRADFGLAIAGQVSSADGWVL